MKTPLSFILFVFAIITASAQDIQYSVSVVNNKGEPAMNLPVVAMETFSLKTVAGKTNSAGKAMLTLPNGREWAVSIGEIKKCMYLLAEPDRLVVSNKFFVYDPKDYNRKKLQDPKRSTEKFKVVQQTAREDSDFKPGTCFLAVTLKEPRGMIAPNVNVALVNVKDSIVYTSKTNEQGRAFFIVPNKNKYEIDVGNLKNFAYCDFGDEYAQQTLQLGYAPTIVNEKIIRDTVYQQLDEKARPSSERTLMRLFVQGGKKNGSRERVYLRQLATGKVFASITDDKSFVYFLVPNHQIYMVDFNHRKNVDGINLTYVNDITSGRMTVHYNPDPRLEYPETFIPTSQNLILKNFNDFLQKQFTKPTDKAFSLEVKSVNRIHKATREALFLLTLAGAEKYGNIRLPVNAALVLDKSGSMYSYDRSESLKRALLAIGKTFTDTDVVSVIFFDDNAFEVQHTVKNHFPGLEAIAQNYNPGGGTNIFSGLKLGVESLMKNFDNNKSNKIILLTDGYDATPPEEITEFVAAKFKEGIEFSSIGLGTDYNQSLLELIALKGSGTFSYVDQSVQLSDVFLKEVKNSFGYSAKELKVDVFHNEKLIFSNLYGYPVSASTNKNITFEIGKVPYSTNRIAFLKFKLNSPSKEIEASPLVVKVSYTDLATGKPVTYQQEVPLQWTDETDTELVLDQEEKKLYAIAILNQSMKAMADAYEKNDPKGAKDAIRSGKEQIEAIFPAAKPNDILPMFEEADRCLQLLIQVEKNKQ